MCKTDHSDGLKCSMGFKYFIPSLFVNVSSQTQLQIGIQQADWGSGSGNQACNLMDDG